VELLWAIHAHSKSKDPLAVVAYLEQLVQIAKAVDSVLVFSIKVRGAEKPSKRVYFSATDKDGYLHNLGLINGERRSYHPIKLGSNMPDYSMEGIFYRFELP